MEHIRTEALIRQQIGRFERPNRLAAGRDECDVRAFPQPVRATDGERTLGRRDNSRGVTRQSQVGRAIILHQRQHCSPYFTGINGSDHHHIRHGAKNGNILDTLMRLTGRTGKNAAVATCQLDVQARLSYHHPDLIEVTGGDERCKRRHPRYEAHGGQPGGYADQILLGDAHFQKTVGICRVEDVGARRVRQIAVQDEKIGICPGQFHQGLAKCHPLGHLTFAHCVASSSRKAALRSSPVSGRACQPNWFSIKETPLPLTVCATTTVGRPSAPSCA